MATKKYQVQIVSTVCMSRSVSAGSMEEALKIADALAQRDDNGVQAKKGWDYEYCENSRVTGVFS